MQISVQIVVQTEIDEQASVTEIGRFEREGFDAGSRGLHLDEAKALLGRLQRSIIDAQAAEAIARMSVCSEYGFRLTVKGHHRLAYRAVFGRLSIDSYEAALKSGNRSGSTINWGIQSHYEVVLGCNAVGPPCPEPIVPGTSIRACAQRGLRVRIS